MRRAVFTSVAVVLVVAVGGLALAETPGEDGAFFGCALRATGALRLIDLAKGQDCKKSEVSLSWNSGVVRAQTSRLTDLPGTTEPQDRFQPRDSDLHQRLTLQSFTTESAQSHVTITLQAPARASSNADDFSCVFQLRVDGVADTGYSGSSRSVNQGGLAAVLGQARTITDAPLHISAYFDGLGAGQHELTLWVAGFPGTTCWFNPGNFTIVTHIEESIA